ncbi:MAG: hemolysin family protein [Enterobacteriaceae bacterium]
MLSSIALIFLLIAISAFFSVSEISLAASRKIKLKQLADEGDLRAHHVLRLQEHPGQFFTVVQIGLNAVAILGGIVGDAIFSPAFEQVLLTFFSAESAQKLSFILSFTLVTSLFILLADLMPKRLGMVAPETLAVRIIYPMRISIFILRPFIWFFNGCANMVFRLFNVPLQRKDDITSDDICAMAEAGASAGFLRKQEHELIENVFDLESRTVPSSMTMRENMIYFDMAESEESIKQKIAEHSHSKYLVCDGTVDKVVGYVGSKDLLNRVLNNQSLVLSNGAHILPALMIPDSLTLSEVLECFKNSGEDFAVILNEYALVVGIITLKDVMNTLMGDLVGQGQEEQIICRDDDSWLMEGATPIDDIMRVLDIDEFPQSEYYETIGGFMMTMLRKIPKRTDSITFAGYKFEVVDIDNNKIDQLLVTRLKPVTPPELP